MQIYKLSFANVKWVPFLLERVRNVWMQLADCLTQRAIDHDIAQISGPPIHFPQPPIWKKACEPISNLNRRILAKATACGHVCSPIEIFLHTIKCEVTYPCLVVNYILIEVLIFRNLIFWSANKHGQGAVYTLCPLDTISIPGRYDEGKRHGESSHLVTHKAGILREYFEYQGESQSLYISPKLLIECPSRSDVDFGCCL